MRKKWQAGRVSDLTIPKFVSITKLDSQLQFSQRLAHFLFNQLKFHEQYVPLDGLVSLSAQHARGPIALFCIRRLDVRAAPSSCVRALSRTYAVQPCHILLAFRLSHPSPFEPLSLCRPWPGRLRPLAAPRSAARPTRLPLRAMRPPRARRPACLRVWTRRRSTPRRMPWRTCGAGGW